MTFGQLKRNRRRLAGRFGLGVIANQARGARDRLRVRGWAPLFAVCISSGEEGIKKPEPAIFELALQRAGCRPDQAVMVGDRIDNDVAPARAVGMATVRIHQGLSRKQSPRTPAETPDVTIRRLRELPAALGMTPAQRHSLLAERLGAAGEGSEIRPPFHCDYGFNVHLGRGVFLNFDCVILDVVEVEIGDGTQIGPAVQIYTAGHPLLPEERITPPGSPAPYVNTGKPVTIGDKCWIGGGAIILPGVTIGDGCTIGAGSVVTKSVPPRSVAAGNPCRILKTLP